MGLEAVVIGGVTDGAVFLRQFLQMAYVRLVLGKDGFFHQHMLAMFQQITQHLHLGLVGNTGQHRVVRLQRHVFDSLKIHAFGYRIHRGHHMVTRRGHALMPLHAHAGHHHPQLIFPRAQEL